MKLNNVFSINKIVNDIRNINKILEYETIILKIQRRSQVKFNIDKGVPINITPLSV